MRKAKPRALPDGDEAGDRRTAAGADLRDELLPRHSQTALLAKPLKTVTFEQQLESGASSAFPTEQAVRQKENLKAKKEAGGQVQKKKQIVEAHSDDCGMDLSGIEADIAGFEQLEEAALEPSGIELDVSRYLAHWLSSYHWLFGSSASEDQPLGRNAVRCDGIEAFLIHARNRATNNQMDIMEMFGGAADTSRILVKRCDAVSGINFDLTCGFNLRNPKHVSMLFQYVDSFKPVAVVMAPPCTGLKGRAGINAQINPQGHARSVENSTALGRLAARIAA
jgi:hypothetical protein